jgi:hypothetical protein
MPKPSDSSLIEHLFKVPILYNIELNTQQKKFIQQICSSYHRTFLQRAGLSQLGLDFVLKVQDFEHNGTRGVARIGLWNVPAYGMTSPRICFKEAAAFIIMVRIEYISTIESINKWLSIITAQARQQTGSYYQNPAIMILITKPKTGDLVEPNSSIIIERLKIKSNNSGFLCEEVNTEDEAECQRIIDQLTQELLTRHTYFEAISAARPATPPPTPLVPPPTFFSTLLSRLRTTTVVQPPSAPPPTPTLSAKTTVVAFPLERVQAQNLAGITWFVDPGTEQQKVSGAAAASAPLSTKRLIAQYIRTNDSNSLRALLAQHPEASENNMALHEAVLHPDRQVIIALLIEQGFPINLANHDGLTPFQRIVKILNEKDYVESHWNNLLPFLAYVNKEQHVILENIFYHIVSNLNLPIIKDKEKRLTQLLAATAIKGTYCDPHTGQNAAFAALFNPELIPFLRAHGLFSPNPVDNFGKKPLEVILERLPITGKRHQTLLLEGLQTLVLDTQYTHTPELLEEAACLVVGENLCSDWQEITQAIPTLSALFQVGVRGSWRNQSNLTLADLVLKLDRPGHSILNCWYLLLRYNIKMPMHTTLDDPITEQHIKGAPCASESSFLGHMITRGVMPIRLEMLRKARVIPGELEEVTAMHSPLQLAVINDSKVIYQWLITEGANPYVGTPEHPEAAQEMAKTRWGKDFITTLPKTGAPWACTPENCLGIAQHNSFEPIEVLLNTAPDKDNLPLKELIYYAAIHGNYDAILLLLNHGAPADALYGEQQKTICDILAEKENSGLFQKMLGYFVDTVFEQTQQQKTFEPRKNFLVRLKDASTLLAHIGHSTQFPYQETSFIIGGKHYQNARAPILTLHRSQNANEKKILILMHRVFLKQIDHIVRCAVGKIATEKTAVEIAAEHIEQAMRQIILCAAGPSSLWTTQNLPEHQISEGFEGSPDLDFLL